MPLSPTSSLLQRCRSAKACRINALRSLVAVILWVALLEGAFFPLVSSQVAGAAAPAAASIPPLVSPPLGERWFSIVMNDEKTGFASTTIKPAEDGYELSAEGSAKMVVMGFSREAASKERYRVNRDLSLRSFSVEQIIDGSAMKVSGDVTPKGVRVVVETKGQTKERFLKAKEPVYPSAVLNLYPLMRGFAPGKKYRVQMLDVEAVKIKEVRITAVGVETMPGGIKAVHLQNDLYSFVSNDIWVDLAGNTVRESVRDGMIETRAEQPQAARQSLVDAALAKKDLVFDFSRIPVAEPLPDPRDLSRLKLEISRFPDNVPVLEGAGQQAERLGGERVVVTVSRKEAIRAPEELSPGACLGASDTILSDHRDIIALKDEIVQGEKNPLAIVAKLNSWVATNIKEAVTDTRSPLETLATRSGNCQSHARLYVSLARAAGVPSRFVSGIVFIPGKGFLYHSWAESHVGGWMAVDPTFNEMPANATHVKLVEGESPQEMMPIIALIGRIRIAILEKETYARP